MTARRRSPSGPATLWLSSGKLNQQMVDYTVGDDRAWDGRLLRWDVLGSLGHIEGLRASRLATVAEHRRLRTGLRAALRAVDGGTLRIRERHEDAHTAVEEWLTARDAAAGARLHTGRSRNDQVACDLRLFLKDRTIAAHAAALALAERCVEFAARHRTALWPGYTHTRRAMPSSAGLWAAGYAAGVLDTLEALPSLWTRLDRSPLGSAAGYGVPLPLRREAAARALGFAQVEPIVTSVQGGRGKLEASALAWCAELGHEFARLSADVILFSAEEYGYLQLPAELATGSSIMPQKRNPDLFELTRGRAAALEGELFALMRLKGGLSGGYHRDYQLLKAPLIRGLDHTVEMAAMLAAALPLLGVDRARGLAALRGGALATDEVMRRVELGQPFRSAYREVARETSKGEPPPTPSAAKLLARRRSTGGLGNLGLDQLRQRVRACRRWQVQQRRRFDRAMQRLEGRRGA